MLRVTTWLAYWQLCAAAAVLLYVITEADVTAGLRDLVWRISPRPMWVLDPGQKPLLFCSSKVWQYVQGDSTGMVVWDESVFPRRPIPVAAGTPGGVWYSARGSWLGRAIHCTVCSGFHAAWIVVVAVGRWHASSWQWWWGTAVTVGAVWLGDQVLLRLFNGDPPWKPRPAHP